MKNFPNQVASLDVLRSQLMVFAELADQGANVNDNSVVGYEFIRRRISRFRDSDPSSMTPQELEERIAVEQARPSSMQTPIAMGKEVRRTLQAFGWIDGDSELTGAGSELLSLPPGSDEERAALRVALLSVYINDDGHPSYSHPVLVLLRLLRRSGTISKRGLELALVANDDSEAEFLRVASLYDTVRGLSAADRAAALGVSTTKVNNAVKVLPPLAKYAGLVAEGPGRSWSLTTLGETAVANFALSSAEPVNFADGEPDPSRRRPVSRGRERSLRDLAPNVVDGGVPNHLTPDQQDLARARLMERTNAHQTLVRQFAGGIDGGTFYEDPSSYDLVWVGDDGAGGPHLFEMKSINGDADRQIVRAIGQLCYYAHFNVVAKFGELPVTRTIVVNDDVDADLCSMLEELGIGIIQQKSEGSCFGLNPRGQALVALLRLS